MNGQAGLNQELIKTANQSRILYLLNEQGPQSRKELAGRLSLTPAALTQITTRMLEEGVLEEVGERESSRAGRKEILLDIRTDSRFLVTAAIEAGETTMAVCPLKGKPLAVRVFPMTENLMGSPAADEPSDILNEGSSPAGAAFPSPAFLEHLREAARAVPELIAEAGIQPENILGIGISLPGVAGDRGNGVKTRRIWREDSEVRAVFEEMTGFPAALDNNVRAFARAELIYGREREKDNLLFVKWGPGVGSAIVAGRRMYDSATANSAELGHITVEKNGRRCWCGKRGCLETVVSARAIRESGDPKVREKAADALARAVVNAATFLAPDGVIYYGSLFEEEDLRTLFCEACRGYDGDSGETRLTWSELRGETSYIGPQAVGFDEFFLSKGGV